jgi:quercetin dioxygenase-like cupin family protein
MTESLSAVAAELLHQARTGTSGRAGRALVGGAGLVLRQTAMALLAGEELAEHASPGEATLQVLEGEVELRSSGVVARGAPGDLLVIPDQSHSLAAITDSVVLLTVSRP